MGNYGIRVAQKGYDAKTCPDDKLVFSSSFQTLKIFSAQEVSTTIPSSGTNTITVYHNLGFYAPYVVIYNGDSDKGTNESSFFTIPISETEPPDFSTPETRNYSNRLEIDVEEYHGNHGATIYFTVYIFLNDFSTISPKTISTSGSASSSSSDYGIRVSKEGYDVKTCDDVDLVVSSSFFGQTIHMQGISTSDVVHALGYVPNYLSYGRNSGDNYISFITESISQEIYGSVDDNKLYTPPSPQDVDYMYYIIFKNRIT